MSTLIKIIITTLLSFSLFSCNFDINLNSGVRGNGQVKTMDRSLNQPFTSIKSTEGLDVYLTQGESASIQVEADENLHDLIVTEVVDGVLKIHTLKNIGSCKAKKIMISFKDIAEIKATSGSDVFSTNTITVDDLVLTTTSGSDMILDVNTTNLLCKSTSGSDLNVSGTTKNLVVETTSGSDFKGEKLIAQSCNASASSGSDITLNTQEKLIANASSGGDIKYYGDPKIIDQTSGSSGSIKKK
ncbi:head GIN domain-containing protein [Siansivirga zeaxanthinifaciens]|uniref:Putative auto-transporter adhesin head GIN domain-containing protein n=1 Tax=Siansivirga zeaxanthinifaciens CC-SAMT-1 TaxID=1454006 RepID=A0A0C5W9F5_9FLAO|nr:head GIN domain-containing protein [Siansivirga zeaxanthinifaciens]AJR03738.1 hypothetical protein AW14_09015 [Siansivirga zeaxanthinifaciens CC-SAMT-1]